MEMLGLALMTAELLAVAGLALELGFRKAHMNTDAFEPGRDTRRFASVNSSSFDDLPLEIVRLLERERVLNERVAALEARLVMPGSFLQPTGGR